MIDDFDTPQSHFKTAFNEWKRCTLPMLSPKVTPDEIGSNFWNIVCDWISQMRVKVDYWKSIKYGKRKCGKNRVKKKLLVSSFFFSLISLTLTYSCFKNHFTSLYLLLDEKPNPHIDIFTQWTEFTRMLGRMENILTIQTDWNSREFWYFSGFLPRLFFCFSRA